MDDESVNRASEETSAHVDGSVASERKSVMRGGHDPRELARLSAEARARRRNAQQSTPAPPPGGNETDPRPLELRLQGVPAPSGPRDLHQLSEDALVDLLNSPSETARVNAAKILHERSMPKEKPPEPKGEPRQHDLLAVLRLAARSGVIADPAFGRSIIEALREGRAEAEAERQAPVRRGTLPAESGSTELPDLSVSSDPTGPPANAYVEDDGRWVLVQDADRKREIDAYHRLLEEKESERITGGWRDPDLTSGEAA